MRVYCRLFFCCLFCLFVVCKPLCELTVTDIRVSVPSPYGDGAKTQGHALYNRPLDAHARRRKSRRKDQEASKIFIYFILKFLDFFIEENVVSLFHWALFVLNFDFVSKKYKLCHKI